MDLVTLLQNYCYQTLLVKLLLEVIKHVFYILDISEDP